MLGHCDLVTDGATRYCERVFFYGSNDVCSCLEGFFPGSLIIWLTTLCTVLIAFLLQKVAYFQLNITFFPHTLGMGHFQVFYYICVCNRKCH